MCVVVVQHDEMIGLGSFGPMPFTISFLPLTSLLALSFSSRVRLRAGV